MWTQDEGDKLIVAEKGDLIFVFNFHPTNSYSDYRIGTKHGGAYKATPSLLLHSLLHTLLHALQLVDDMEQAYPGSNCALHLMPYTLPEQQPLVMHIPDRFISPAWPLPPSRVWLTTRCVSRLRCRQMRLCLVATRMSVRSTTPPTRQRRALNQCSSPDMAPSLVESRILHMKSYCNSQRG